MYVSKHIVKFVSCVVFILTVAFWFFDFLNLVWETLNPFVSWYTKFHSNSPHGNEKCISFFSRLLLLLFYTKTLVIQVLIKFHACIFKLRWKKYSCLRVFLSNFVELWNSAFSKTLANRYFSTKTKLCNFLVTNFWKHGLTDGTDLGDWKLFINLKSVQFQKMLLTN